MNNVGYLEFCSIIAKDYNIKHEIQLRTYYNEFPFKNGKKKINATNNSKIVDFNGNEFPYMITPTVRNEEKLIEFDYIYRYGYKSLREILKESNLTLLTEYCKICEGGGWYSHGKRYFYKDYCLEY
jgi:hypothetical protein